MASAQPVFEEVDGALHSAQLLLDEGHLADAQAKLERAYALFPADERVRNLLGMVCFKAGHHDRAAELYGALIADNPQDTALRVNLGLVFLKMGDLSRAVEELQIATELDPEHARARNYLGVALGQLGDYGRAKEQFLLAGSTAQADRMEQAHQAAMQSVAMEEFQEEAEVALTHDEIESAVEPSLEPVAALDEESGVPEGEVIAEGLSAWAEAQRSVWTAPKSAPFRVEGSSVWVTVKGQLWIKPSGLRVSSGALRWVPGVKRFGGKYSDRPLGDGRDRIFLAEGEGSLFCAEEKGKTFTVLEMGEEDAFFQLRGVYGLEGAMAFENGRLPSGRAQLDLEWMQVRGPGSVLLCYPGLVTAVEVRPGVPIQVPLVHLAGWYGQVATRLVSLWEGESAASCIELSGEGVALWVMPEP